MYRHHLLIILVSASLFFVACGNQEETTPETAPETSTVEPTATTPKVTLTSPEPTEMPTELPPTEKPKPAATSKPEAGSSEVAFPAGAWEGAISTSGVEILIHLVFSEDNGRLIGTIDIPQQGASDIALANVSFEDGQIHFEIAAAGAIFDGEVTENQITGEFVQGPATGTFAVSQAAIVEEEGSEEAAELPYAVEEVSWMIGETTVAATLTVPEGSGPFPAIILVAGSGPTDRDWNSPLLPGTNGSGALFADMLTKAGFVTLRYDKRVSGPDAMANLEILMGQLSLESHREEVAGGISFLANHNAVDIARLFGLANSEGTIHILNYQRQDPEWPLAGLILAAPPGRSMPEVLRSQIEPQLADSADPKGLLALFDEAMERFLAGKPIEPSTDLPEAVRQLLLSLEAPANLPFTRELFKVDSASWLADIEIPVLVLIGKKDIQIDWQLDGQRLEEAVAGNLNVIFVYPENANHVFKHEEKLVEDLTAADAVHYNSADRVLDQESVRTILAWLHDW